MSDDFHSSHHRSDELLLPQSHKGHEEEGEGNWLVSYADMMTLLVGFFIILMSFSNMDSEKFDELRKAATIEFGGVYEVPFGEVADRIKGELQKLGLSNQFSIKQLANGVQISFLGTVFFNTASAEIKPEAMTLLDKLIPIVQAQNFNFDVVVEGHTDDVPINSTFQFKSNWELSSVRACRVLAVFEKMGFEKSRLTALGYGEARPIVPNRDPAGNAIVDNQSQNRRVVIKLLKPDQPVSGPESKSEAAEEPAKDVPPAQS